VQIVGIDFWSKALRKANIHPTNRQSLYWLAVADKLVSGSLYYSLVGVEHGAAPGHAALFLAL
jgi:hypothetical protein